MQDEDASGKHLIQLGFMRRYDVGYAKVKEALLSGEYGEPLMLHCTHRNPAVSSLSDEFRFTSEAVLPFTYDAARLA